ncbi:MAG: hypothetical protein AB4060_07035 [Crocosphaera sp.]
MTYTKDNVSYNFNLTKAVANAPINMDFLRASYSDVKNRKNKLVNLPDEILKTCISYKQGIHPRRFCRRWFGLEAINHYSQPRFTEQQIVVIESEHGYREQCINLLARVLKIKPNTIHRWGKGVAFNKIPDEQRNKYETYLGYVDTIRVITTRLVELDEDSLLEILQQVKMSL